nr:DUF4026 domain-containing protein [Ktedonobacterales bacterium]
GRQRVAVGRIALRETLGRVEATFTVERHAHPVTQGLAPEALDRLLGGIAGAEQAIVRAGTLAIDAHFTLVDADVPWCLRWAATCLAELASTCDGIVVDLAAQRCQTPTMVARLRDAAPLAQIALHNEPWGPELRWLHTHGLQKFGQPELELVGIPQMLESYGAAVLRSVAEPLAAAPADAGVALRAGMAVECDGAGTLLARNAPVDADHQAPYGRLRLVTQPVPGQEPGSDAAEVAVSAALAAASDAMAARNAPHASEITDRVLVALPNHPAALALKARLLLAQAQPGAALEIGTFLATHAPRDPRGPLVMGMALLALGRQMEALGAFNRAITRDPEDPAPYEARAHLYDRLGQGYEATADRARAKMLRG